jgi:nicotinamidase-related amidase
MTDSNLELRLDPRRTAIVVIDLQKGIVGFAGAAAQPIVDTTARLLAAARQAGAQPILVRAGWSPDGADRLDLPVDAPMRTTALPPGWTDLVPELDRQPGDLVILKRQWGAFYGTDLDLQLRRRDLTSIVLCGIATEAGVESTARDAWEHGYQVIFAVDAMGGVIPESHINSIERIFPRIGRVRTTDQIIAALQP